MPRLLAAALGCVLAVAIVVLVVRAGPGTPSPSLSPALAASPADVAMADFAPRADRSQQREPLDRVTCWNGKRVIDHPLRWDCPRRPHPAGTSPTTGVSSAQVSSTSARGLALQLVGQQQFGCLDPLWDHESGWSTESVNPSSGAAGIPQMLPSTWASYGYPYFPHDAATQVKAGLRYIDSRYGSPCGAWAFWQGHGWY